MIVEFVRRCASAAAGTPFLGFADSRSMVEQIVAASAGPIDAGEHELETVEATDPGALAGDDGDSHGSSTTRSVRSLLPYRAGYEDDDRRTIQDALMRGDLRGVISTSAMELGLDVGNLDLVILLLPPSSRKAFWQRVGRAPCIAGTFCRRTKAVISTP